MLIFRRIFLTYLIVSVVGSSTIIVESIHIIDGVVHKTFGIGDEVPLYINSLTSSRTQMPIDYEKLPFYNSSSMSTKNKDGSDKTFEQKHMNMGQKLAGDRIRKSPYELRMKMDLFCKILCVANLSSDSSLLKEAIQKDYYQNWIVDNLDAASVMENNSTITTRYFRGIPLGFSVPPDDWGYFGSSSAESSSTSNPSTAHELYIYNHVNIRVHYNRLEGDEDRYQVLRFLVNPLSIKHDFSVSKRQEGDDEEDWQNISFRNPIPSCDRSRAKENPEQHTTYESAIYDGERSPQKASGDVLFTYDVEWIENPDLQWSERWEIYLTMDRAIPAMVHWFSIFNTSVVLVVLVTLGLAFAICRLRNAAKLTPLELDEDLADSEQPASQTTQNAEAKWRTMMFNIRGVDTTKWRVLHADVFRPPSFSPFWFCVACGTGAHLLAVTLFYLVLCLMGVISEARRGSLTQAIVLIFPLGGFFGGYVTRRFCQMFNIEGANEDNRAATSNDDNNIVVRVTVNGILEERKQNMANLATVATALCFQQLCFLFFISIQYAAKIMDSTLSISVGTVIFLANYETLLTLLCTCVGAHRAENASTIVFPTETRNVPRVIPRKGESFQLSSRCGVNGFLAMIASGLLPFSAFFVELYYLLAAHWMDYHYFSFEFLLMVCFLMISTCGMANILITFLQLCYENHRWWWNSWSNGCATGLFVFFYSFIFQRQLEGVGWFGYFLYFGSMVLFSLAIGLMLGFVGVTSSLWFTMAIYGMIVQNA